MGGPGIGLQALIAVCRSHGVEFTAVDGKLMVKGDPSKMPAEFRAVVKARLPDIRQHLGLEGAATAAIPSPSPTLTSPLPPSAAAVPPVTQPVVASPPLPPPEAPLPPIPPPPPPVEPAPVKEKEQVALVPPWSVHQDWKPLRGAAFCFKCNLEYLVSTHCELDAEPNRCYKCGGLLMAAAPAETPKP